MLNNIFPKVKDLEDELKGFEDKCSKMREEVQKITSNRDNKAQRLNEIKEKVKYVMFCNDF